MTIKQYKTVDHNWRIKEKGDADVIERLTNELSIDAVLANLLAQRGITSYDEAKAFFRPSMEHLHDPFLMKNMDQGVNRLKVAIDHGEKILVYGDYDVDGTTSVALVYLFLNKIYDKVGYYVPDRYSEGYGISMEGIQYAETNEYSLVVALDCGIKAVEKIEHAKQKGIDFIICDHHTPADKIPEAMAVLDPKQPGCEYPYKDLSGCGVGFKLIQGYCKRHKLDFSLLEDLLDLVAVSIASDIVPVTGENRVLAHFGLKKLNDNPGEGLKAIIKSAGLTNKQILIDDIVFKIGPRINAAGRMESGRIAVELLVTRDEKHALKMSKAINICNNSRKNIDRQITLDALNTISADQHTTNRKTSVLFNPEWHEGVLGIVASRLKDYYYRPTVVLTKSNGMITGSARSVEGYNLYNAVDACSDLLENFGGHKYAAGLTLSLENLPEFERRFEKHVAETITEDLLTPCIEADDVIDLHEISPKFYRILKQFQPFGPENMAPVFLTRNVSDSGYGRIVGSTKEHLKLDLVQEHEPMHSFPGIAFQKAQHFKAISMGNPFDICYSLEENEFMGKVSLQIRIKDIKVNKVVLD
jgi:single-stranded-DNA-specific exonuclease